MSSRDVSRIVPGEFGPLNDYQRGILDALLAAEFQGKDALVEQSRYVQAREIDVNGSLQFAPTDQPLADVLRRIPVEAEAEDADGVVIHILLHVLDGCISELELYREDSQKIANPLDPAILRVLVL